MRILFYIPNLSKTDGGIYQYALSVLQGMGQNSNVQNEFFVFSCYNNEDVVSLANRYKNIHQIPIEDNESKLRFLLRKPYVILNKVFAALNIKFRFKEASYVSHLLKKYEIDVLHSPHQSIPNSIEIPSIVTLHDVQELYFPEYFTAEQRAKRAVSNLYVTKKASAVVVSFDHVRNDIVRFFQVNEEKVKVCFLSVKGMWFEKFLNSNQTPLIIEDSLQEGYIFYPAITWPHKNHIQLLEAMALLKKEKNMKVNLVCTGHQTFYIDEIKKRATELGVEQQLVFKGLVSDEELYSLYKKATAVVIPSLYEAGSFPLIEAMVLGVPVICANTTSLPNTIGDERFVFKGNDVADLANKLSLILSDTPYIEDNKANSKRRAEHLMNSSVLEVFSSLYQEIGK